ncbi:MULTISPECIES: hypothetical protein [Yersinia pseudotuberculosis complex]|uniref:Beta-lactamase fold Zn-dependent hydrolase n=6 Tax=Yersinia pseudotuberculosis complex TaxID=1649845 RepID=A0A6B3VB15_YERPE|nr:MULTISPECIES: hypothetical protein [Yersinia pseudotuberculosis complex]EDR33479.1 conserved hypothetical protein [Yersinia pestis biovar Orientalis str. IP275]EFA48895.1 conserved hypothetical protein [Yersinia pestis KIM D27]ERP71267.1 membrane protein [Yersinia pestis S3]ERP71920.1 membrane protein [Yersinia pestis 24H]AAM84698.1 hypothetical [Yersinia pestis KIM10+]
MPDIALTNRIVKIHLSSWRYFALLTLPPLVLAFNLLYSFASLVLLMLFLVTHYYCWRLWLDERLFTLLNKESSLAEFDEGMAQLWIAKSGATRTLTERWCGVRGLFYRAMFSLIALWLTSLSSVLYLTLTLVD